MSFGQSIGQVTGLTGRWFLSKLILMVEETAFFWVCLKHLALYRFRGRRLIWRITVQQIYFTGFQSLEMIALLAVLFGALVVFQGMIQLGRVGSLDELSFLIIALLIREVGPLLTAVVITLRSGSAIAMEMGYMKVLGEIEGLEMQGLPVFHVLAGPRLIGVMVSMLCLMILFDLVAVVGGFLAIWAVSGIAIGNFFINLASAFRWQDFLVVGLKGVVFGLIIPVVCIYHGLKAEGNITSVPPRVSQALVDCLAYMVVFSILISTTLIR